MSIAISIGRYYEKALLKRLINKTTPCIVCKKTSHVSAYLSQSELDYLGIKFDHPFVNDNLKYLEWKSEQQER